MGDSFKHAIEIIIVVADWLGTFLAVILFIAYESLFSLFPWGSSRVDRFVVDKFLRPYPAGSIGLLLGVPYFLVGLGSLVGYWPQDYFPMFLLRILGHWLLRPVFYLVIGSSLILFAGRLIFNGYRASHPSTNPKRHGRHA